jgi:ABC-type uncharacterized transport system permease subunit
MDDDKDKTSKLVASLAGPTALTLGLSMLINRDMYPVLAQQVAGNLPFLILSGVVALVAGLAIIRVHNEWSASWRTLVTILGWLLIFGGITRIVLPRQLSSLATSLGPDATFLIVPAIIVAAIGAFLSYKAMQ